MDAAVTLTSKLRAKVGNAGATIPKPSAITKLTITRTQTSRGSREAVVAALVDVSSGSACTPTLSRSC
jgi:hypothetical protein